MLGWVDDRPLRDLLPEATASAIKKALGYTTAGELLQHYPRDYAHQGNPVAVGNAQEGDVVTCVGQVTWSSSSYTSTGKFMHKIVVDAGDYHLGATFFQARLPAKQLVQGARVMLSGKLKFFRNKAQLSHPSYVVLPSPESGRTRQVAVGNLKNLTEFGSVDDIEQLLSSLEYIPIYPARKGITSWRLLGAINAVLHHTPPIPEPVPQLPEELLGFDAAIRGIHQPDHRGAEPFQTRIKFNEALSLALVMALRRADAQARQAPQCAPVPAGHRAQLENNLPFSLTDGQRRVVAEISQDIAGSTPMNRLVQGEVGSGKTMVAILAMLQVVDAGRQCAFLAPTEVLAIQHARSITATLSAAGVAATVTVLTGSLATASKRKALLDIVSGEANIVVGTHALIQEGVEFFDLGLVVVDEQHRFGVQQRDRLRDSGKNTPAGQLTPHLMVMTATPIPRTIAMTTFGDLEVSTLEGLPGGRQPISSVVVPGTKPAWVARAWERIREEVQAGHQCFVVCPKIEGDGGAEHTYQQLATQVFPELSVGLLHGRLPAAEKEAVMRDFAAGGVDVLVATTVIEVGIDVPNATVMYIRNADSLGVSQLHQLRGRVGRGSAASLCLMHTEQPEDSPSFQRLTAVAATSDGFTLAEVDLASREEGDVLGTEQSGTHKRVKLLNFLEDADIIERAANHARLMVQRDPQHARRLVSDVDVADQEFIHKS